MIGLMNERQVLAALNFKWMTRSIRTKLAVLLLLSIGIPMLSSIAITYLRTNTIVTEHAVSQNAKLLYQAEINLTNYLEQFNQLSLVPYNNTKSSDTLYRILEQGKSDYLSEEEIFRNLQSMGRSVKEVYQVYLHANRANRGYLFTNGLFQKDDQIVSGVGTWSSPYYSYRIMPVHHSSTYSVVKPPYYSPIEVISFQRTLYQIPSNNVLGTLAIDIRPTVIDSICSGLYDHDKEQLYVLDKDGSIIYAPNKVQRGTRLGEPWVSEVLNRSFEQQHGSYQPKE